jgi:hypothetical protein
MHRPAAATIVLLLPIANNAISFVLTLGERRPPFDLDHGGVTMPIPIVSRRLHEPFDLTLGEVLAVEIFGIRQRNCSLYWPSLCGSPRPISSPGRSFRRGNRAGRSRVQPAPPPANRHAQSRLRANALAARRLRPDDLASLRLHSAQGAGWLNRSARASNGEFWRWQRRR